MADDFTAFEKDVVNLMADTMVYCLAEDLDFHACYAEVTRNYYSDPN